MIKGTTLKLLLLLLLFTACNKHSNHSIYQLSTVELLMSGNYDGQLQMKSLRSKGDFGIGTFDKLDGEMIIYKHEIYKAQSNGTVSIANENETTPYASVCVFHPTITFPISNINTMEQLDSIIKHHLPNENNIYAIEITGMFDSLKLRSVTKQAKPYRPLVNIVKEQVVFNHTHIAGTLIGFYSPSSVKSIMIKGLHLHFLSNDLKKGGHVLSIVSNQKLVCNIACYTKLHLDILQYSNALKKDVADKNDLQKAINKVEK
jgi:acetolactate decarboxylase